MSAERGKQAEGPSEAKFLSPYPSRVEGLQVSQAEVRRVARDLVPQKLNSALHAVDAEDVGEHEGATQADRADAECQELQDVGSVADAAVRVDLDLAEDLGRLQVDLVGHLEGRGARLELAAAVVGEVDGRDAVRDGVSGLVDVGDALQHDWELCHDAEGLVIFPLPVVII